MEELILVDEKDNEIGSGEKMDVHVKGKLHRAFSLFMYDPESGEMLIQKRSKGKYHSGGLWTNSCCSHPRRGESLEEAVRRRVEEELGIVSEDKNIKWTDLQEVGSFEYCYHFETCTEHEIDHVFYLPVNSCLTLRPEEMEIESLQWIPLDELCKWVEREPEAFTVWFLPAFKMVREQLT